MIDVNDFDFNLFPAHAGVILKVIEFTGGDFTFPRTRGGDPKGVNTNTVGVDFSPHTRG